MTGIRYKYSDGFFDVDARQRFICSWPKWEFAYLAFDSTKIASVAARDDAFLEDFVEHGVMKGTPLPRGE
jgi:hypothetical protein